MKGPRLLQQDCPHDGDYRHQGQRHFQGDPKARKKLSMQVNHKWYSRPILIRVRIAGLSLERVHVHVHVLSMYNQLTTPSIVLSTMISLKRPRQEAVLTSSKKTVTEGTGILAMASLHLL